MTKKLETLKERKDKLAAQIRRLEQKENAAERKRDTRRKILLGSMMLEGMAKKPDYAEQIKAQLDRYLTRDIDRALFELGPKTAI